MVLMIELMIANRGHIRILTSSSSDNDEDSDTTDDSGYVYRSHSARRLAAPKCKTCPSIESILMYLF